MKTRFNMSYSHFVGNGDNIARCWAENISMSQANYIIKSICWTEINRLYKHNSFSWINGNSYSL